VLPLNATNGNVASLLDNSLLVLVVSSLDKKLQATLIAQSTDCLGSFVSAHRILLAVTENLLQVRDSSIVARLAQTVGEFVLEESRGRSKSSGNSINSRNSVLGARFLTC
jgi:hypothetical protein